LAKYKIPIILFLLFEIIAIVFWLSLNNLFFLLDFSYIGICLALGTALYAAKFKFARNAVQLAIGLYMLIYLGIILKENMMIEGFWYYLFLGVFKAAVIHYLIAKILGPLIFARGWCGYACWTAMVLDLLPYKTRQKPRKNLAYIRYMLFVVSLLFVGALFVFSIPNIENIMFWSFIIGNLLYYGAGILLAFIFKDNRAFCKYICPITAFLKPASYFSIFRVKNDVEKCVNCGKCKKVCPMDVDMTDNSRKRTNGTECILCYECVNNCPKKSLHM